MDRIANWLKLDSDFNAIPTDEPQGLTVFEPKSKIHDHLYIEMYFLGQECHMGSWVVFWTHGKTPYYGKNNYFHSYKEAKEFYDLWKVPKFFKCEENLNLKECTGNWSNYHPE
jgi:hypothetical protein